MYYYFNKWSKYSSFNFVLNDIGLILKEILNLLEETEIEHKSLFINANSGFYNPDLSFLCKKNNGKYSKKIQEMDKIKIFILMKDYIKIVSKLNEVLRSSMDLKD